MPPWSSSGWWPCSLPSRRPHAAARVRRAVWAPSSRWCSEPADRRTLALGARRVDVVSLVVREALMLVLAGVAVGVPTALLVARQTLPASAGCRDDSTQNSLPSGSRRTTHVCSPWPTSARVAPRSSRRATAASRSSGRKSRCRRFLSVFGSGTRTNRRPGSRFRRRPDLELLGIVVDHDPLQGSCPPPAQRDGIGGVHDHLLPLQRHQLIPSEGLVPNAQNSLPSGSCRTVQTDLLVALVHEGRAGGDDAVDVRRRDVPVAAVLHRPLVVDGHELPDELAESRATVEPAWAPVSAWTDGAADAVLPPCRELHRPGTVDADGERLGRHSGSGRSAVLVGERAQLVALRIGEDHPLVLAVVGHDGGPEVEQGADVGHVEVEMHPVLHGLRFRHHVDPEIEELRARHDGVVASGTFELLAQRSCPEPANKPGVGGVEAEVLER